MKKFTSLVAVALFATLGAGAASAQDSSKGANNTNNTNNTEQHSVYGKFGTTGLTAGYAQHFDKFNLRADINFLNYSRDINAGGVRYDSDMKMSNIGLFADYFPSEKYDQFRLVGGALIGNNKINSKGVTGPDSDLPRNNWANASSKTNHVRPYLGIGWGMGSKTEKGFSFVADLGASYGKYRTNYDVSPCLEDYWGLDGVRANEQALNRKINDKKWQPVVSVGIAYRF